MLGLRSADPWEADDLEPVVDLPAPPAGIAVADALCLARVPLDAERAQEVLEQLDLLTPGAELHHDEHGAVEQIVGLEPSALGSLLSGQGERKAFTSMALSLDPVLYGRLREESLRDPRVVTALGQDPTLGIKVGWLFSRDLTAASITVLDVRVGEVSFSVNTKERPSWMTGLLQAVGKRFARPDPEGSPRRLAEKLLAASLSADVAERAGWRRLAEAMAQPPFELGRVELVQAGDRVVIGLGEELRRLRQLGPRALSALRLAVVALLDAPDVLIVDEPVEQPVRDWLIGLTTGEGATLEQVLFVGGAP